MNQTTEEEIELEFQVLEEDWSRYKAEDNTVIRFRVNVAKIFRSKETGETGYPTFGMATKNLVSAIVPEELKGEPSKEPLNLPEDIDKELDFDPIDVKIQKYLTEEYLITLKPNVLKIFRTKKYNDRREPIYYVSSGQPIFDVKKRKD